MSGVDWRLTARRFYLLPLRGAYRAVRDSRFGALARLAPVQRALRTLRPVMDPVDVFAVLDAIEARGVAVHLMGGWGVDALVGRQTRQHLDLDVICAMGEVAAIDAALSGLGYHQDHSEPGFVPECPIPARRFYTDASERRVDVHLMEPGLDLGVGPVFAEGSIAGRKVGCLSGPAQLVFTHGDYEPNPADRHNLVVMCEALDLPLPARFR
ncbi:MAG TPA: hypothetical protein VE990_08290 [Acidimicrobiales bacterium]|nr:hypothetical protein [Acidimicrobiales bacterium]